MYIDYPGELTEKRRGVDFGLNKRVMLSRLFPCQYTFPKVPSENFNKPKGFYTVDKETSTAETQALQTSTSNPTAVNARAKAELFERVPIL